MMNIRTPWNEYKHQEATVGRRERTVLHLANSPEFRGHAIVCCIQAVLQSGELSRGTRSRDCLPCTNGAANWRTLRSYTNVQLGPVYKPCWYLANSPELRGHTGCRVQTVLPSCELSGVTRTHWVSCTNRAAILRTLRSYPDTLGVVYKPWCHLANSPELRGHTIECSVDLADFTCDLPEGEEPGVAILQQSMSAVMYAAQKFDMTLSYWLK